MDTLDNVMLQDTWVLGWQQDGDRLVFTVEASLWPGHPSYEPPKPGEWTCYKRGRVAFDGVQAVQGLLDLREVPGHTDPDGSQDYGSIDVLGVIEGGYRIAGEFGDVVVRAKSVRLELD